MGHAEKILPRKRIFIYRACRLVSGPSDPEYASELIKRSLIKNTLHERFIDEHQLID